MTFPATDLVWKVEFNINGVWTDVTSYVLFDGGRGITVANGLGSEDIDGGQPSSISFTADNTTGDLDPDNALSQFYPWLKLGMGVRASYDTGSGFSQRGQGEVYSYEPNDRPDGLKTVRINPVSASKRVFGGARNLVSALRSTTSAARPVFYAALEDGTATTHPQVTYGSGRVNFPGQVLWGDNNTLVGSKALPTMGASAYFQAIWDNSQMSHQRWQFEYWQFVTAAPAGNTVMMRVYTDGSTPYIDFQFSATLYALVGVAQDGSTLWTTGTFSNAAELGRWRRIKIMAQQNGANVDFKLVSMNPDGTESNVITASVAGTVGAAGTAARIGNQPSMTTTVSIGHVQVWDAYDYSTSDIAGVAFAGEQAWVRWDRVMTEIGDTSHVVRTGSPTDIFMGKQGVDNPNQILQEVVDVSHGYIDTDKTGRIRFTDLFWMQDKTAADQSPAMTVDYSQSTVYDLQTARHDTILWNEVDASMPSGPSVVAQRTTGRYQIADPPTGIGRRPRPFTFNLDSDADLPQHAGWELNRGTIDKPSVKALVIKFHRKAAALAALLTTWKTLDTGSWVRVSNPPSRKGPDSLDIIMLGYEETGNQKELQVTIYGRPIADYHANEIDVGDERIDSDSTALLHPLTTADTSIRIYDTSSYYFPVTWAHDDGDYLIRAGGRAEDMNVTAVAAGTPSFVNAGTAAHADNASVNPGQPASIQKGDLIFGFTAIRNTAAFSGAVTNPGGWLSVIDLQHISLVMQVWDGAFGAPTFGFSGGAAGDTTSAQLAAFRNVAPRVLSSATVSNASAQNIAMPALTSATVKRHKPLLLAGGWKQDDLLTAALTGWTQIGAPSSTLGNDQSLCWFYLQQTETADIAAATATITGGASAISKGFVVAIDTNVQILTATRHVNSVSLTHIGGEEVHVKSPIVLSL